MSAALKQDNNGRMAVSLDRLSVCVSAACLVQCLVLPVLLIALPIASLGFFGDEIFHLLLLAVILPLSTLAFLLGWNFHRNTSMLVPGIAGLVSLMLAASLGHDVLGNWGETFLTVLGGILLISGHILNLRSRRRACVRPLAG